MGISLIKADKVPLSEKAAEEIIKYIRENRMQKGDWLPNERALMEQLSVSRSTLREAMRSLSSRGIVVIKQGCGTCIATLPGVAEDPLGLQFKYDKKKMFAELLELRFMMEPGIASISAQRASAEDVEEICRLSQAVADCIRSGANHIEQDVAFHCKIAQSTGNDILDVLFSEIVKGVRLFTTALGSRILQDVIVHHENIATAIKNRDAEGAYQAMKVHLEKNKEAIAEYLGQSGAPENEWTEEESAL